MSGGAARRVAGIVLAAGSSTRMGRNKLLLELDGEAVVRRAVRRACAAGLDPVVVVTGHEHEAVTARLHDLDVTAVNNTEHAKGTHTSVAAGVASVRGGCEAAVVVLADMPFVTRAMLREVVARHRRSRPPLVVSRYGGDVTAPPILYDRALFDELAAMDSRCGRAVVRRHLDEAVLVDWPAGASRDLDRPADYEGAREALEGAREARGRALEGVGARG